MKLSKAFLLMFFFLLLFCTGCNSSQSTQHPASLRVTRIDNRGHDGPRVWMITDTHAVQQLFDEVQNLPAHQNNGADSCARPRYSYTLDFLVGTKSIQKDELYVYCSTLTLPDGNHYDSTANFDSQFAGMLHLPEKEVRGF